MVQRALAVSAIRGVNFLSFIGPDDSALNTCIPPTPSKGRIAIVNTNIPIPPIHCNTALQIKIDLGILSNPEKMVAPVVVRPETDSKKALIGLTPSIKKQNGIEEISDKIHQTLITSSRPSLGCNSAEDLLLLSVLLKRKKINKPKKKNKNAIKTNFFHINSKYIKPTAAGTNKNNE
jgi:hypothetical protein